MKRCAICYGTKIQSEGLGPLDTTLKLTCDSCGTYTMSDPDYLRLDTRSGTDTVKDNKLKAILLHHIAFTSTSTKPFHISEELLEQVLENPTTPSPTEQANLLIEHIGNHLSGFSNTHYFPFHELTRVVIAYDHRDTVGLIVYLYNNNLTTGTRPDDGFIDGRNIGLGLSFDGWKKYEELNKTSKHSAQAFMAMKFEKDDVLKAYKSFQVMCKDTGFELLTVAEKQETGIIHNRLKLQIKKSRFMIADLTHQNNGVYWEAGYAEGQNIDVFYTCEEVHFKKVHFDLKPSLIFKWSHKPDSSFYIPKMIGELQACIINTLKIDPNATNLVRSESIMSH